MSSVSIFSCLRVCLLLVTVSICMYSCISAFFRLSSCKLLVSVSMYSRLSAFFLVYLYVLFFIYTYFHLSVCVFSTLFWLYVFVSMLMYLCLFVYLYELCTLLVEHFLQILRYVNLAMKSADATIVVPVNFVIFTISAILAGMPRLRLQ